MTRYSAVIFFILTFQYIDANDQIDARIVDGTDANIHNFGYQVSIELGPYLCGGALIRNDWVCTAAHCTVGIPITAMKVRLGSSFTDKLGVVADVEEKIIHKRFNQQSLKNDISLLKLKNIITKDQMTKFGIRVIALCDYWPQAGEIVWVTGFGALFTGGPLAKQLQKVQVRSIGKSVCQTDYRKEGGLSLSMECAGLPNGGKDSCEGDSGGPLVHNDRLCGVVSWGLDCASPDFPGVYTSVPYMKKWILSKLN